MIQSGYRLALFVAATALAAQAWAADDPSATGSRSIPIGKLLLALPFLTPHVDAVTAATPRGHPYSLTSEAFPPFDTNLS